MIDTIEQYAPGFRWSERQILECFHTCIAHPHKSHSLKLRAGQASLARRFFPLLSWRGSLVLLEVHHLNHVQHIIKVFFFTEWRLFNVIWWHFTSGNIFHGSMSLDQLYMARPTPTLARWSGVDDDVDDGKVYWGNTIPSPHTPIPGLLLCGSGENTISSFFSSWSWLLFCAGAHPGGGVMGAPGRIAAKAAAGKILNKKWTFE